MALAMTFLGLSPMGLNDIPAVHPDKPKAAEEAGRILVEAVRAGRNARSLITPESLRNAAVAGTATAGSTNLVLHLLAIAREAGIPESDFDIDLFDEVSRATPVIADLKPGGRFMAPDMSRGRRLASARPAADGGGPDHRHADRHRPLALRLFRGRRRNAGPGGDRHRRRSRSRRAAASASSTAISRRKAAS